MNRKQKIIVSITGIVIVLLILLGLTYAYFVTQVDGNLNPESISVTTANLKLVYGGDDGSIIGENEIIEPNKTFTTKTFTVTNAGNETISAYAVILDNVSITDATSGEAVALNSTRDGKDNDFDLTLTCKNGTVDCNGYADVLPEQNAILVTNSINPGETHTYSAVLKYVETNDDQSSDMNKHITGRFNIIDTEDTAIIEGKVTNTSDTKYYVQTNSTKRISYVDVNGNYKIYGLESGEHTIKLCELDDETCATPTLTKELKVTSGTTPSANNITGLITIKDDYNLSTININIDESKIEIKDEVRFSNAKETLVYHILNNGAQVLNAKTNEIEIDKTYEEKTEITKVSDGNDMTDTGIFTAPDDYGTSYYFRGPVKNNYVNFAGFTWRIVRINGDGSVRLILDGTLDKICVEYNEDESCKTYAGKTSAFNSSYNNNAYVGYMYGLALSDTENIKQNRCLKINGTTATNYVSTYTTKEACEEFGGKWTTDSYEATHANVMSSTIKTAIDTFYETYIENNENNIHYEKYLADTLFCNDKTVSLKTDLGSTSSPNTTLGVGKQIIYYAATERLYYSSGTTSITTAKPSLKCAEGATNNYSRLTSNIETSTTLPNGTSINNDLKHPIALLSADELVLAGAWGGNGTKKNQSYYLYDAYANGISSSYWWALTPSYFDGSDAYVFYSNAVSNSLRNNSVYGNFGPRPVINLRSNILIESGNGTSGSGAYTLKEIS